MLYGASPPHHFLHNNHQAAGGGKNNCNEEMRLHVFEWLLMCRLSLIVMTSAASAAAAVLVLPLSRNDNRHSWWIRLNGSNPILRIRYGRDTTSSSTLKSKKKMLTKTKCRNGDNWANLRVQLQWEEEVLRIGDRAFLSSLCLVKPFTISILVW